VRRRNGQRGGATTEFALVLPLFLAVMFATVDYGWYYYQKFTLCSAVQGGLRAAVSVKENETPDPWESAHIAAKVLLNQRGSIPGDDVHVTFGPLDGYRYGGFKPSRYVILSATYTFTPLVGFVKLPSNSLHYQAQATLDAQNADI
jgi:hypothetical protein